MSTFFPNTRQKYFCYYSPCSMLYLVFIIIAQVINNNIGMVINIINRNVDFLGCFFLYSRYSANLLLRISLFLFLNINIAIIRPISIPKGRNGKVGILYKPIALGNIISPFMNNAIKKVIDVDAPHKGYPMS